MLNTKQKNCWMEGSCPNGMFDEVMAYLPDIKSGAFIAYDMKINE